MYLLIELIETIALLHIMFEKKINDYNIMVVISRIFLNDKLVLICLTYQ